MDIYQINKYWSDSEEKLCIYNTSQLYNPRLLKSTSDFLIQCGMPESCAPGLSFNHYEQADIPTPNEVFNIYIDELKDYLMIGSNGSGDPICIDLGNNNEIVYLNHDNYFERIYMNGSLHQLTECIIRYRDFYTSLDPKIENNIFIKRKFSDEEFSKVCDEFNAIDDKCLKDNNCWKAELDYLVWERDNE
jgi:hypothetical protein